MRFHRAGLRVEGSTSRSLLSRFAVLKDGSVFGVEGNVRAARAARRRPIGVGVRFSISRTERRLT